VPRAPVFIWGQIAAAVGVAVVGGGGHRGHARCPDRTRPRGAGRGRPADGISAVPHPTVPTLARAALALGRSSSPTWSPPEGAGDVGTRLSLFLRAEKPHASNGASPSLRTPPGAKRVAPLRTDRRSIRSQTQGRGDPRVMTAKPPRLTAALLPPCS
jgi:hypothetical protein